ncbi:Crooked neck-like protein 1 [Orobanche minor]
MAAAARHLPRPPGTSRGRPAPPAAARLLPRPPGTSRGRPAPPAAARHLPRLPRPPGTSRGRPAPPAAARLLPRPPGTSRGRPVVVEAWRPQPDARLGAKLYEKYLELLWKAYIDFEISECEYERSRTLYERLLNRTKHSKGWISYAKFEASTTMDSELSECEAKEKCIERGREVCLKGGALTILELRAPESKEERTTLLEEWLKTEISFGEDGNVDLVNTKLPKKVEKRMYVDTEDGYEEEYRLLLPGRNTADDKS